MMENKCESCQLNTEEGCPIPSYFKGSDLCKTPKGDTLYQQIKQTLRENEIWMYIAKYNSCCFDNQTKNVLWNYVKAKLNLPIDSLPIDIAIAELSVEALFGEKKQYTGVETP